MSPNYIAAALMDWHFDGQWYLDSKNKKVCLIVEWNPHWDWNCVIAMENRIDDLGMQDEYVRFLSINGAFSAIHASPAKRADACCRMLLAQAVKRSAQCGASEILNQTTYYCILDKGHIGGHYFTT